MRHVILAAALTLAACAGESANPLTVCDHGEKSWSVYVADTATMYEWSEASGDVRVVDVTNDAIVGHFGPYESVWTCEEARDWTWAHVQSSK